MKHTSVAKKCLSETDPSESCIHFFKTFKIQTAVAIYVA